MTPLQGAAMMASLGFRVFPVKAGTKGGHGGQLLRSWKAEASVNAAQIGQWAANWPGCNWAFVCENIIAVDVDLGTHAEAATTIALLDLEGKELPPTRTHGSARAGAHMLYRLPEGLAPRKQRDLGPGINTRVQGGYLMAPGSVFEGKPYTVSERHGLDIQPAPQWLIDWLEPVAASTAPDDFQEDSETAKAWAIDWLAKAPRAVKGERGSTVYKAAAHLKDIGLSEDTAYELIATHYTPDFLPPLDDAETRLSVEHAFEYSQNAAGSKSPDKYFGDLPAVLDVPQLPAPAKKDPLEGWPVLFHPPVSRWRDITPVPQPFFVAGLVPLACVTLFVAAGGRGKTMASLQMMLCASASQPFLGLDTMSGRAAGMFCEDPENVLHLRFKAICSTLGLEFAAIDDMADAKSYTGFDNTLWLPGKGPTPKMHALEKQLAAIPGLKLFVLDGVSHVFAAAEYDRGEVTRFVSYLNGIAERLQIAIILIHHESKTSASNDTHAASGSTGWINASRAAILLQKGGDDGQHPTQRVVKQIKNNYGPLHPPILCEISGGGFAVIGMDEQAQKADALAIAMLNSGVAGKVRLTVNSKGGDYAPRAMAADLRSKTVGIGEADFEASLTRLLQAGVVEIVEYGDAKKGKRPQCYVLASLPA
jgi:hypothetical protein